MLLVDDILMAPIHGLAAVCQRIHQAAQEELESQEKAILASLTELYQELDNGRIGDDDFNARECKLLDSLESCQKARSGESVPAEEAGTQEDDSGI